ncbi:hypothetical protein ACFQ7F_14000 [Streptomyces sp. NPDC056486]|uniref:hypothetical protein n=1 Tax=Streptomyces sp. NPDC056486 TaxID=3345835 RepID=UPI0036A9CC6E
MSVDESWEKIERWLDQYAPQEQPLPGPCTSSELDGLYSALGGFGPGQRAGGDIEVIK